MHADVTTHALNINSMQYKCTVDLGALLYSCDNHIAVKQ